MFATEEYFVKKIANLEATIQRIRELHTPEHYEVQGCSDPACCGESYEGDQCSGCFDEWPCSTIKALDGAA